MISTATVRLSSFVLVMSFLVGCEADEAQVPSSAAQSEQAVTWQPGSLFRTASNWWTSSYNRIVFLGDADGDGKADVVGVAFSGDVHVALSTGTAFATAAPWLSGSIFQPPNGWFATSTWDRVWLVDVTGDGKADLLGVANNGDVWVSESTGTAFKASHRLVGSPFATPTYFDRAHQNRMWLADVNGDHKADLVGIDNAGDIDVQLATGSGSTATFAAASTRYLTASIFQPNGGWFVPTSQPRVFLGDVSGDGLPDFVGIDNLGNLWVSEGTGTTFKPSRSVLATNLLSSLGWFDTGTTQRVWLADVTGDGKMDFVGVAPANAGDGDVWLETATGSGTTASFSEHVALRGSVFKTSNQWFATATRPRVFVADVTGDGRADLVGIATTGDLWVSKSSAESGSATAPVAMRGTRDFYLASSITRTITQFQDASGLLSTSAPSRIWLADVTGDNVSDLIGIAPASPVTADGDIVWESPYPASVVSVSNLTRANLNSGTAQSVTLTFSRSMAPSTLTAASLVVLQDGLLKVPTAVTRTAKTATWSVPFSATGTNPSTVTLALGSGVTDLWARAIDGNGGGHFAGTFSRALWWNASLVAGAAKVELTSAYPHWGSLPAPSGFGFCAATQVTTATDNPPRARVLVIAGGGSCTTTANCRTGQTCVANVCQSGGVDVSARPLVMVSVDAVGFNTDRVHDLLANRFGFAKENILVSATHAHAVARNIRLFTSPLHDDTEDFSPDSSYQGFMEDSIANAVASAITDMTAVTIGAGSGTAALGVNRRNGQPVDPEVLTVKLKSTSPSRVRGVLVNYAMHPVVMDGSTGANTDYPGYLTAGLETADCNAGDLGCGALFLNGGAGDVNPANRTAGLNDAGVAASIAATLRTAADGSVTSFQSTAGAQILVEKHVEAFAGITSCRPCLSDRVRRDGQFINWDVQSTAVSLVIPHGARLLSMATLPGEPFSAIQGTLKSAVTHGMLLGYTNGYMGYLPTFAANSDTCTFPEVDCRYGVFACADSTGITVPGYGPSFFNNSTSPTPGEKLMSDAIDALNNRLAP